MKNKVVRRTFEALKFEKGSLERQKLNEHWLTSEYYPSYRYGILEKTGHGTKQFRTKKEAELVLLTMGE